MAYGKLIWFRFMVFNTTFNNISIYRGGQCYWWRRPAYREKDVKKYIFFFQIIN